jgi:hypothetical protein
LVRRTFLPIDADVILRIKLSAKRPKDFWDGSMSRMDVSRYEVRMHLYQSDIQLPTSSSVPFGDKSVWKKIWKCKVQLKVRIFAWKSLSNGLAIEANKKRRHIPVSSQCRICGHDCEDSFHALIQCPHAAALWAAMRDVWDIPVWKGGS